MGDGFFDSMSALKSCDMEALKNDKNMSDHFSNCEHILEICKEHKNIPTIRLETARYLRPIVSEDQRLCYCDSGAVESEFHILFICKKYSNLREAWMTRLTKPDQFHQLPPQEKFKLVLNLWT